MEYFDLKTRLAGADPIWFFLKSKNDWRRCTFRSDCFRCTVRILINLGPKFFSEAVKREFPNRPVNAYVEARCSFNNMANERNCNSKKKAELDQLKAAFSVSHCSTEKENLGSTILTEVTLELVNPYEKDAADNDIDDEIVFGRSKRKHRSNFYKRWPRVSYSVPYRSCVVVNKSTLMVTVLKEFLVMRFLSFLSLASLGQLASFCGIDCSFVFTL